MAKTDPIPLNPEEMREMYKKGATVSEIAAKARIRNKLSKSEVREIIFGKPF